MKTKLLLFAVALLTMLSTSAVAQSEDASQMRELMKGKIDQLNALVPSGVKGLTGKVKKDVNTFTGNFTNLYNASPLRDYDDYKDGYDFLEFVIGHVNKYLAAYKDFSDKMNKLEGMINHFNADTEKKQQFKTFAQNVYNAYWALSANDMIALNDEDKEELLEYEMENFDAWEMQDVQSWNIDQVADNAADHLFVSTYDQFNNFFSQNSAELGSIYISVDAIGTKENPENLTAQLRNPDFETPGEQWWGTEWSNLSDNAAEQYGKAFETYQQVHLPQGYYTLVAYCADRRSSINDILANLNINDNWWLMDYSTQLYAKVGDDDTIAERTYILNDLALTTDITNGAGNISSFDVAGTTYYLPNSISEYRAWEDAKINRDGHGHGVVLQFQVWQDGGEFAKLGFANRAGVESDRMFLADGIKLYYATDDYPEFDISTPDYTSAYIPGTGKATLYTTSALDFSGVNGLTAYTAKRNGSTVTLTQVDNVPANTGVVLMGESNTYRIPKIASSTTDKGDLKGSATDATAIDDYATVGGIYTFTDDPLNNQMNFVKMTVGSIPAGEPYLLVPSAEETTDIMKVVMPGATTNYDLTLADGSNAHGTVTLSVGGSAASQAQKDDVVTITVTPNEGYLAENVTVRSYTTWEAASEILTSGGNNPELVSDITVTKNETDGTWQFTMPEANVWIKVTYTKNLQDAWIQTIANQTYTGSAIEPTIEVKDGETTLVANTDYTVAYTNNTEVGEATVTVTGTGNYSGTATATFYILANKTELNNAITEAENYYNSISESNPTAAAALQTAINTAKGVQANPGVTQDAVENAVAALTYAVNTAKQAVLTDTKTALSDAIAEAEAYYESIKDSNPEHAASLKTAIDAAKHTQEKSNATQEQVDAALAVITVAKTTAEEAVLTETKTALDDAITEAENYYNSISESNPTAAAALQTAINTAKGVQANPGVTQDAVENAVAALTAASNDAKAEVALKRITLTIPAKSYMARIDADKRQIETAVEGVKLYSVKSVSSTEVELTGELSVIAAEMPYFIYNDNDTEVEVNIVVSSEDASNVEYDSEHFKGTLVDKTFTDEDMQEADHYVLTGKNFVWVKDAGTLAAGKCWIELIPTSTANARALSIVAEGATGISTAKTAADNMDGFVYDLQGRRIVKPTKGVVIINGKKVLIK